jgi:hypothetical protein
VDEVTFHILAFTHSCNTAASMAGNGQHYSDDVELKSTSGSVLRRTSVGRPEKHARRNIQDVREATNNLKTK